MIKANHWLRTVLLWVVMVVGLATLPGVASQTLPSGAVWFNGQKADLEKPVQKIGNQFYITFVDLVRHIGGALNWGADDSYIECQRGDTLIRVIPNRSHAYVNGIKTDLGHKSRRMGSRTYVPLKPYCQLFGLTFQWDSVLSRIYVSWSEET